ncbi:peptidyl-prolyl cis-trans isomerase PASTICCINO1-like isoform X1 [Salvia miltiorrhiza]|uniref:peptidyl-prolyl cis-trans isomerase PASTICCINO1-like isoform X1 n=2 Tax=Salvia miltiorrhiza TaxID=226208 RepID=UPI0025ACAAEF|nr:peptidyl-prolyl cis-trans isomerase PASTICCINO1-like isoform X1 [Salvia miltiorrhiza]XP_057787682.1 peptidyl-prolyl cis-trans isomerase PASTICCINO1-like isoform X1 [Salvia miltiorrhiza]
MAVIEESEPEFKQQNKKPVSEDDKRRKKMPPGSLMKALIRPGAGEKTPTEGDQVIYHCTIRTLDGVVVESTRAESGGIGIPKRQVLGKSKIILGLLEGFPTMLKGEVAMFKVKPELHYGEEDCPVSIADGFPKDDELHFEIELIEFSKVKAITEDLGVLKKVEEDGQGWEQPREPYEVKAWISGKSGDGNVIFSHTHGEPFLFTFGKSEIPKGLEMGIGTMTRGEKAVIYVIKDYLTQCPLIPFIDGVAEVHFEVELLHFVQVRDVLGDGRLIKRRLHDGRGEFPMDCPLHDSLLRVHYKGMLLNEEKTVFYDTRVDSNGQPFEFRSGEGLVPEGFEMCTRLMLPGEIASVTCPPDYAYDKFPRPAEVPQGAYVQWEIELLDYEKQKDWTGYNFREIMDDVEKIKGTGNRLFKEGKYELAKAKYEHVLREFNHVNPQDDDEGKEFSDTRNLLHLNMAACLLKMGEYRKSIESCNKVLDANPAHVKALYRRGMAYIAVGNFEEARADFSKMMSVDKSSEATANAALLKLKKEEQEIHKRARQQFKGLFDKKPGEISEAGGKDLQGEAPGVSLDADALNDDKEHLLEATAHPPASMWSRLWPSGRKLFTTLGLDRCAIL